MISLASVNYSDINKIGLRWPVHADQTETHTYQLYRQVAEHPIPLMTAISTEMNNYDTSIREAIPRDCGGCVPANVKQIYEHPPAWNWVSEIRAL